MTKQDTDPVPGLLDSLELVDDAIGLVGVGLNQNPSMDEERTLSQQELRLKAERGVLQAEVNAAASWQSAQGPSDTQHAAIVALSIQVEAATNANAAASLAIGLVSETLGLIAQVVST